MRTTIISAAIIVFSFGHCFAQQTSPKRNLYAEALSACVHQEAKQFSRFNSERDLQNRIVEYDLFLTSKLPTQIGNIKIEVLGYGDLVKRYKKVKKNKEARQEIPFMAIRPMQSDGITIKIDILDYWFGYKKRSYYHALEGGCHTTFTYDSEQKQFVLSETLITGI